MNQIHMLEITMNMGENKSTIYPVLLQDERNLVLVDCGFMGSLPLIKAAMCEKGLRPEDVTVVVLTHHDHDHMGSLALFKREHPHLRVFASALEEPYVTGRKKSLRLAQAEERQAVLPPEERAFGERFCAMLRRVEPVAVDELVADGQCFDWCGGCKIVATPGHMPGHISLYLPGQKTVIAGDALSLANGRPAIANPQYSLDMEQAARDMEKLLSLDAEIIICYHGGICHR